MHVCFHHGHRHDEVGGEHFAADHQRMDRDALRQFDLHRARLVQVEHRAVALTADRRDPGSLERFHHVHARDRALTDHDLGAVFAEHVDRGRHNARVRHDPGVGVRHASDIRLQEHALAAGGR